MKKVLMAVAAIAALPATTAQAQDVQMPGVYFGVEGGLNWMFNTTILGQNVSPLMGWAAGGKIGYDFIGPRVEVEGLYRENQNGNFFGNRAITGRISQTSIMANLLYDFNATGVANGNHTATATAFDNGSPSLSAVTAFTSWLRKSATFAASCRSAK